VLHELNKVVKNYCDMVCLHLMLYQRERQLIVISFSLLGPSLLVTKCWEFTDCQKLLIINYIEAAQQEKNKKQQQIKQQYLVLQLS